MDQPIEEALLRACLCRCRVAARWRRLAPRRRAFSSGREGAANLVLASGWLREGIRHLLRQSGSGTSSARPHAILVRLPAATALVCSFARLPLPNAKSAYSRTHCGWYRTPVSCAVAPPPAYYPPASAYAPAPASTPAPSGYYGGNGGSRVWRIWRRQRLWRHLLRGSPHVCGAAERAVRVPVHLPRHRCPFVRDGGLI